jgi:hypothetical protein
MAKGRNALGCFSTLDAFISPTYGFAVGAIELLGIAELT